MASQRATEEFFDWFLTPVRKDETFYIGPTGRLYLHIDRNGRDFLVPTDSQEFIDYALTNFYSDTGKVVGEGTVRRAVEALVIRARDKGCKFRRVNVRVAYVEEENALYLDLNNDADEAAKVTEDGWEIVKAPEGFFRPATLDTLPKPEEGGSLEELQDLLAIPGREFDGVSWFLKGALAVWKHVPGLIIQEAEHFHRSLLVGILKSLIDPERYQLSGRIPRNNSELALLAETCYVVVIDPLFSLPHWVRHAVEGLMRGRAWHVRWRGMYEEVCFEGTKPVILAGYNIPSVTGMREISTSDSWQGPLIPDPEPDFQQVRPRLLGAILNLLRHELWLRNQPYHAERR